jgi:hypothetical protein
MDENQSVHAHDMRGHYGFVASKFFSLGSERWEKTVNPDANTPVRTSRSNAGAEINDCRPVLKLGNQRLEIPLVLRLAVKECRSVLRCTSSAKYSPCRVPNDEQP